ncbi:MAG: hypothetical protein PHE59_02030 [Patescibacteria group bacterium]|nr:hypothetical protein [Patescibacteria group bacterium]MDD5164728.1 hypothetical protein [Patescibacteria group bacterium]MDD5534561.1 hypothetical protein [Patescibacteria group bacterium]
MEIFWPGIGVGLIVMWIGFYYHCNKKREIGDSLMFLGLVLAVISVWSI